MLSADGKSHPTDVATAETLFRIIQTIPSKKAEPFKQWMAQVAAQRLKQMQDPELNFEQAYNDYHCLGYPDKWINQRLKSIEIAKRLPMNRRSSERKVKQALLLELSRVASEEGKANGIELE